MEMIANAGSAPAAAQPFADGIYFGLNEGAYHRDLALGSSDLKRLYAEPADYWYGSPLNPNLPPEETTPAQLIGKAVHKLVLEGAPAFHALYGRAPDGDDLLRTSDDLGAWLKEIGQKAPASKAARIQAITAECIATGRAMPRIADVIEAEAVTAGVTLLKPDNYDRIVQAGRAVLHNPYLAASFVGGAPEVSIFWTEQVDGEPVRRKARFDYLKPRAVVDLKSVTPRGNMSFPATCRKAIATWDYPTQAAAYLQARVQVERLARIGRVFGDHDPEWLGRVALSDEHAFVFVFWSSAGAPLTWGGVFSPGNGILDLGESQVTGALWNYVAARRRHGLVAPWIDPQPLAEIELDHMPGWFGR